jgi:tripartite-type tricarboxylate transporter receptor subunit TctC
MRVLAAALILFSVSAFGQAYPSKPVRMVVPFPAGGPADLVARLLSSRLPDIWGHPLVVENRGGAGGNIGTASVARAAPDGYTIRSSTSPRPASAWPGIRSR